MQIVIAVAVGIDSNNTRYAKIVGRAILQVNSVWIVMASTLKKDRI